MENRFSVRDFIICSLLVILIGSVWLGITQFDRQWDRMTRVAEEVQQQTTAQARMQKEIGELRDLIEEGVRVVGTASKSGSDDTDQADKPVDRVEAARTKPGFAEGDWLVDAFGANVARVTPLVTGDAYGSAVQGRVLESLLYRDPVTLKYRPLLARSLPTVSEDGLTFTFKLRRGVTFSDGEPLTAHDVTFTFDLIMNDEIDAPRARNYFDKIKSVTATNDYEVVFQFKEPYFQSMGMAGQMDVLPKHFYSKFTPDEINRRPGLLLGSGPYRMESPTDWAPGKLLIVVRNERYWGTRQAWTRMVFKEINNEVARQTSFRNGEIDILSAQPEQYVKLIKDPQILESSQRFEYERPTGGYGYIAWNQKRNGKPTFFADARVRRAMTMLIDRNRINKELLFGYGIIPSGPFNRLSRQYDQSVKPLAYDPDRALSLLNEAGFKDRDGDGVLESRSGKPFEFKYTYPASSGGGGLWDKMSLFIKDGMARVGIVVQLDPLEWAVFKEKLQTRSFDCISLAWSGGIESDIRQMFHSSQIAEGADNFMHYANPELDKLIDEARQTIDEDKRMLLWNQCHRILNEDQPYTFLYSRKALIFIDNRIQNVERIRIGLNDRSEWFVPKPRQKYAQ